MSLFAAVISVIAMFLHFPANAGGRSLDLGACKLHQQITLISTFRAKHHCVDSMYTKNSSQTRINTSLRHFAPPRGLNFFRPTISRMFSVDVSVTGETWLIASPPLLIARSALGHRPCGICAMLYVSQHPRPCEPWSPRRWWCVVGILGARRSGVRRAGLSKMEGTKVGGVCLCGTVLLIYRYLHTQI